MTHFHHQLTTRTSFRTVMLTTTPNHPRRLSLSNRPHDVQIPGNLLSQLSSKVIYGTCPRPWASPCNYRAPPYRVVSATASSRRQRLYVFISTVSCGSILSEYRSESNVDFSTVTVLTCKCATLPQVLIRHGLFPTAPSQPRMAVSLELLAFYRALFERSCDAINALASALNTHYIRRGFRMTGRQVGFYYPLHVALI